jgi:hypothetical protein
VREVQEGFRHRPCFLQSHWLEEIVGWGRPQIRALFEAQGLVIQDWDKAQGDWLTIRSTQPARDAEPEEATASWVNS